MAKQGNITEKKVNSKDNNILESQKGTEDKKNDNLEESHSKQDQLELLLKENEKLSKENENLNNRLAEKQTIIDNLKIQNNNLFGEKKTLQEVNRQLTQNKDNDRNMEIDNLKQDLADSQHRIDVLKKDQEESIRQKVEYEVAKMKQQMYTKEQYNFILENLRRREDELEDLINTCSNYNSSIVSNGKLFEQVLEMKIQSINNK